MPIPSSIRPYLLPPPNSTRYPPGSLHRLYLGVFCTFAPIGCLTGMVSQPPGGWGYGLVAVTISGLISIAWLHVFVVRRYWLLALVIPLQLVVPEALFQIAGRMGVLSLGADLVVPARLAVLAVMAVAFMVAGYVQTIKFVRRMQAVAIRQQTELDVAAQMHRTLVPPIEQTTPGLSIFGRSEASAEMGGDLIDIVINGDRTDVFLADVSGHGVRAGVLMAMVKSAIRTRLLGGASLAELVGGLNQVVGQVKEASMFVTFAALRFHGPRRVEFTLAGHLPVLWYRASTGEVRGLDAESMPLGVDDSETYATAHADCDPGDVLVLYTDGLTEVTNSVGRQFGLAEFRELVRAHGARPLAEIHAEVMSAVRVHGPQTDDQSLLLVRVS